MNTRGNEPNIMAEAVGLFRSTQRPPFIATVKEATITKKKKQTVSQISHCYFCLLMGGPWTGPYSGPWTRSGGADGPGISDFGLPKLK